ncbi:phosphatidylserine decarboxylase-domain-containing protein [Irpex lacteus]|nr:phosphatidylserine decarboxylase-domain-containing protein [Irpex lacteus]
MSHTAIVQELVDYYNKPENADFKSQFQLSFSRAHDTGLAIFDDYNVHTVEDYFRYMDEYVNWVPSENKTGTNVFLHICLFYFIIDLPPVSQFQDLIDPVTKAPYRWLTDWLIRYAQEMGQWMDQPGSITEETIDSFYAADSYHMKDYPRVKWNTFNEFFARHINKDLRPIAPDTDDSIVITSPADCSYDGQWAIDDKADITTFSVKGVPWSISQLLEDTQYGPAFAGGTFTHSFLGPQDYHRQHAPVSGTVIEAKVIPGICYLEVVLKTDPNSRSGRPKLEMHRHLRSKRETAGIIDAAPQDSLDAPDTAGYQFLQARALILIDNPDLGLVAVLPIGMAQVSSVKLSVQPGQTVEKGDEISYFQLGGSDIIMVFQKDAQVSIHQTLGQHYNYGTAVALAPRKK